MLFHLRRVPSRRRLIEAQMPITGLAPSMSSGISSAIDRTLLPAKSSCRSTGIRAGRRGAPPDRADVPNLDRVARLPDASHWMHHDEPERVAELLIDFFAPELPTENR
jgi:pimeloyl-ACP methyl ester carboxylesterase